jgi:Superinfection immunity protein
MSFTDPIIFWPAFALFVVVFSLPTILAIKRRHRRLPWIIVCNILGMSGITWVVAWVLLASDDSFVARANSTTGTHSCPSCGRGFDLADYRPDISHISCSYCHAQFPKPAA